jgi:T4-like virus tail tube protein gp19
MPQFTVNDQRFNPYKNFKFRVSWDGRYVAGVSKVGALMETIEVVEHREGGDPSTSRKSPGRTKYEPITLERGVTHDAEFEAWAKRVSNFGSGLGGEVPLNTPGSPQSKPSSARTGLSRRGPRRQDRRGRSW